MAPRRNVSVIIRARIYIYRISRNMYTFMYRIWMIYIQNIYRKTKIFTKYRQIYSPSNGELQCTVMCMLNCRSVKHCRLSRYRSFNPQRPKRVIFDTQNHKNCNRTKAVSHIGLRSPIIVSYIECFKSAKNLLVTMNRSRAIAIKTFDYKVGRRGEGVLGFIFHN